jgi:DinB superfamily
VNEERSATLRDLRALVNDLLTLVRGLGEEDTHRDSTAEGWPAVIVAYHIGLGLRRQAGFIARALTGEEPFEFEWEPTHELNAVNAREHRSMPKDVAAEEIEEGWGRLQDVIARMDEEDWSRPVFAFGGRPRSADVVLRRVVVPHAVEHLQSLRQTVADRPADA